MGTTSRKKKKILTRTNRKVYCQMKYTLTSSKKKMKMLTVMEMIN